MTARARSSTSSRFNNWSKSAGGGFIALSEAIGGVCATALNVLATAALAPRVPRNFFRFMGSFECFQKTNQGAPLRAVGETRIRHGVAGEGRLRIGEKRIEGGLVPLDFRVPERAAVAKAGRRPGAPAEYASKLRAGPRRLIGGVAGSARL